MRVVSNMTKACKVKAEYAKAISAPEGLADTFEYRQRTIMVFQVRGA